MFRAFRRTPPVTSTERCVRYQLTATRWMRASGSNEDREELERERKLREQFSQKVQTIQTTGSSGNQDGSNFAPPPPPRYPHVYVFQQRSPGAALMRFFFFVSAAYLLFALVQLQNPRSPFSIMQGIPWWQLAIDSVACYLLVRTLLPFHQQRSMKDQYEAMQRQNPFLSFAQYIQQQHPNLFSGYRTQQAEVIAALCACFAASHDLKFAQTMALAAGSARDSKAAVDNIVDALKRDFPSVFQSSASFAPPAVAVSVGDPMGYRNVTTPFASPAPQNTSFSDPMAQSISFSDQSNPFTPSR